MFHVFMFHICRYLCLTRGAGNLAPVGAIGGAMPGTGAGAVDGALVGASPLLGARVSTLSGDLRELFLATLFKSSSPWSAC
jgi:hypothetical protein